jgi:membrane protease YdiL (CAAX protease family)
MVQGGERDHPSGESEPRPDPSSTPSSSFSEESLKERLTAELGLDQPRLHPLARAIIYFFIIWLGLQIVVGLPAALLWLLISGRGFSGEGMIQQDGALLLFVNVFMAPVTLLVTYFFVRNLDRRKLTDVGLQWPTGGSASATRQAVLGFLALAGFLGLWLVIALLRASLTWGGLSEDFQSGPSFWPGAAGSAAATLLVFAGFMIQGGTEELAFRGYIHRNLRDRWGPASAIIASSFLFAVVHGFNPNVSVPSLVNTFLLGAIFALIIERTGSLWLPALLHGFWNFLVASVLSQPVSGLKIFHILDLKLTGPALWSGGDYGPEGSLVLTVMLLPIVFLLARWPGRRRDSSIPWPGAEDHGVDCPS